MLSKENKHEQKVKVSYKQTSLSPLAQLFVSLSAFVYVSVFLLILLLLSEFQDLDWRLGRYLI